MTNNMAHVAAKVAPESKGEAARYRQHLNSLSWKGLPRGWLKAEWVDYFSRDNRGFNTNVIDSRQYFDWLRENWYPSVTPGQYRTAIRRFAFTKPTKGDASCHAQLQTLLRSRILALGKRKWGFQEQFERPDNYVPPTLTTFGSHAQNQAEIHHHSTTPTSMPPLMMVEETKADSAASSAASSPEVGEHMSSHRKSFGKNFSLIPSVAATANTSSKRARVGNTKLEDQWDDPPSGHTTTLETWIQSENASRLYYTNNATSASAATYENQIHSRDAPPNETKTSTYTDNLSIKPNSSYSSQHKLLAHVTQMYRPCDAVPPFLMSKELPDIPSYEMQYYMRKEKELCDVFRKEKRLGCTTPVGFYVVELPRYRPMLYANSECVRTLDRDPTKEVWNVCNLTEPENYFWSKMHPDLETYLRKMIERMRVGSYTVLDEVSLVPRDGPVVFVNKIVERAPFGPCTLMVAFRQCDNLSKQLQLQDRPQWHDCMVYRP